MDEHLWYESQSNFAIMSFMSFMSQHLTIIDPTHRQHDVIRTDNPSVNRTVENAVSTTYGERSAASTPEK
jgi:hypothetical protein